MLKHRKGSLSPHSVPVYYICFAQKTFVLPTYLGSHLLLTYDYYEDDDSSGGSGSVTRCKARARSSWGISV